MQNGKFMRKEFEFEAKQSKTVIAIVLVVILGVGLYFLITNTAECDKTTQFLQISTISLKQM